MKLDQTMTNMWTKNLQDERGTAGTTMGQRDVPRILPTQYGLAMAPQQSREQYIIYAQHASPEIRHPGNTQRDTETALTKIDQQITVLGGPAQHKLIQTSRGKITWPHRKRGDKETHKNRSTLGKPKWDGCTSDMGNGHNVKKHNHRGKGPHYCKSHYGSNSGWENMTRT